MLQGENQRIRPTLPREVRCTIREKEKGENCPYSLVSLSYEFVCRKSVPGTAAARGKGDKRRAHDEDASEQKLLHAMFEMH